MVDIRIAVEDAGRANGLVRRLVGLFGGPSVSFDGIRNEVRVHSEWGSRAVVGVIDVVESWLVADGVGAATLSMGGRAYVMVRPAGSPDYEGSGASA